MQKARETDEERTVRLHAIAPRDSDRRARETDEKRRVRLDAKAARDSDWRVRENDDDVGGYKKLKMLEYGALPNQSNKSWRG